MLTFTSTGRRAYVNQSGATFRGAPSAGGGGMCPVFMNTNGINQDFCVIAWVKPGWSGSSQYVIFGMDKAFVLKTASGNAFEGRLAAVDGTIGTGGGNQATQALVATTAGALVLNEWNLVAISYNNTSAVLTATVINSANPTGSAANSAAYSTGRPTAVNDCPTGMSLGGGQGFGDWQGSIGTVGFFNRTCSLADLQAIYAARQYLGPWRYMVDTYNPTAVVAFNVSIPGTLVNESGSAIGSLWLVAGTSTTGTSGGSIPGWNYIDSGRTAGTSQTTHRPNWVNNVANSTIFNSHDGDTFFTRTTISGAAVAGGVAGQSSAMVALYAGLSAAPGRHLLIVASNSRAVRRPSAGGQTAPERHSEAYMRAGLDRISGVMNGRFWTDSSEATNAFGLKIAQGETVQSAGTVALVQTTAGLQDFTRAWTGGDNTGAGVSQGQGIFLADASAAIGYKFTPESGSRFTNTNAIRVRCHVLAFPGHCGSILYRRTRSASQAAGTDLDASDTTVSSLNTSIANRDYATATDTFNSGTKTMTVRTNLVAAGVRVGHLCVNTTATSAAEISSISWNGTDTTIVFATAFGFNPTDADTLHFGPWKTVSFTVNFPAQSGGDPLVNRGVLIKAPSSFPIGTMGPIILAQDAWSTDVDGIVIGHAGYSGNGFQNQLTDCWQYHDGVAGNAITNFYKKMFDRSFSYQEAASFNVFLHHADQQVATPGLFNYTSTVVSASPEASVAFMGDQVHGVEADVIAWDTVVLGQSLRLGISVAADARFGNLMEQFAAGHRADSAHPSALGHLACATANIARGGPIASLRNRVRLGGHARGRSLSATAAASLTAVAVIDDHSAF